MDKKKIDGELIKTDDQKETDDIPPDTPKLIRQVGYYKTNKYQTHRRYVDMCNPEANPHPMAYMF